jgi:hypothetical protein
LRRVPRCQIEPLGGIDPDLDQRALATGAGRRLRHQHLLDARQVRRQPAAPGPASGGVLLALIGRALLSLGLVAGE